MTTKTHKPGIHENYLLMRHLKLAGDKESMSQQVIEQLSELREVDEASFTFTKKDCVLNVAYDASIKTHPLEDVERVLSQFGISVAQDWWTRTKHDYYEFVDQNALDNAMHEPWCCHKLPPRK